MKYFENKIGIFIALIVMTYMFASAFAPPNPPADKYQFGKRQAVTLTAADTVDVSPNNLTLTYATMSIDTNIVIDVDVDNSIVGDRIVFEFTADASNRQITWNSNITALADSVVASKIKLFEFVYNGTAFYQIGEQQIN